MKSDKQGKQAAQHEEVTGKEQATKAAKGKEAPAEETQPEAADENAKLTEEVAKWQDKYARLSAEFDNFRKRTLKEKMELIESAGEDVIKGILTVVDDFDRAITANEKVEDAAIIREGTAIIRQKLLDLLRQRGVKEIEAIGQELDTDLHEAIAKIPVEEEEKKGKIVDQIQKGYKLKDKVIRYSKVVVGE